MGALGGTGLMAGNLGQNRTLVQEGEKLQMVITRHFRQFGIVDGASINTRRCAGFKATGAKAEAPQIGRKPHRRKFSSPTRGHGFFTDPDSPFQEGTGAKHGRTTLNTITEIQLHARHFTVFNDQTFGHALTQSQIRQGLHVIFHPDGIFALVGLGS